MLNVRNPKSIVTGGMMILMAVTAFVLTNQRFGMASDDSGNAALRSLVHDEVARQLPGLVKSEVKAQLDELQRQARESQDQVTQAAAALNKLQNLQLLISNYAQQHNGTFPTLAQLQNNWNFLGAALGGAAAFGGEPAEHLLNLAVNPFNGSKTVAVRGHATATTGWTYDARSGQLKVVLPSSFTNPDSPIGPYGELPSSDAGADTK